MYKGGKKVLQILFLLIIFLIFSIILLLVLPYHYALYFKFEKTLEYHLSLSLLFLQLIYKANSEERLFYLKIFNFKKQFKINEKKEIAEFIKDKSKKIIYKKIKQKTASEKREKTVKSKNKFKFDYSLINKENLDHIFKFIIKMVKFLKMDYLKLKLVFSFADPYYNGLFLAYYYTFKELFDYPDLKARINWQEQIFEAEGSTGARIIPLTIIWQLLKFIFSIKSLKIFWKLYQSNSKKG